MTFNRNSPISKFYIKAQKLSMQFYLCPSSTSDKRENNNSGLKKACWHILISCHCIYYFFVSITDNIIMPDFRPMRYIFPHWYIEFLRWNFVTRIFLCYYKVKNNQRKFQNIHIIPFMFFAVEHTYFYYLSRYLILNLHLIYLPNWLWRQSNILKVCLENFDIKTNIRKNVVLPYIVRILKFHLHASQNKTMRFTAAATIEAHNWIFDGSFGIYCNSW